MEHCMKLKPSPFEKIRNGTKTIELRLYDEKRRLLNVGDTIVFTNIENENMTLCAKVIGLHIFDDFEELYKKLPLSKCGYDSDDKANASDMELYYPKELQKQYKVVGIEIELM